MSIAFKRLFPLVLWGMLSAWLNDLSYRDLSKWLYYIVNENSSYKLLSEFSFQASLYKTYLACALNSFSTRCCHAM